MDFIAKPFDINELMARIHNAINVAKMMQLLEHKAQLDGLTGLWNRAYFDTRFANELNRAQSNNMNVGLALCDLDHFKKLNDSFGHPFGDLVLQAFARVIRRELDEEDIACRYGGEEFAFIFPEKELKAVTDACERMRTVVASRVWRAHPDLRVTASFGVTTYGLGSNSTPASWLAAADQALYRAKSSGRDRVQVFEGN